MKLSLLIQIAILALLCSCQGDGGRTAELVDYWQGREIELPSAMTDFMSGDTIDVDDADFTILTYVDSIGCTQCKMKLPLWKEFLGSLDSVTDSDVRFIMVVNSSDIKELQYIFKSNAFEYPVFSDVVNVVDKVNKLPEETTFQTFLLDRNKKVVALGNPVYSSQIGELYKSIISGSMSFSPETGNSVTVSDNKVNLGNLRLKETVRKDIEFANTGNDTVRIDKIISSCECTELSFQKKSIPPRFKVKATLVFSGDTVAGDFERTIHVYYKDFEYPTILNITGKISP